MIQSLITHSLMQFTNQACSNENNTSTYLYLLSNKNVMNNTITTKANHVKSEST